MAGGLFYTVQTGHGTFETLRAGSWIQWRRKCRGLNEDGTFSEFSR
ncbi:hypothetical protein M5E86_21805 [Blautia wexlerae]|nr:hypothetical protein M5E86_21805 [Blautia wexlerae]